MLYNKQCSGPAICEKGYSYEKENFIIFYRGGCFAADVDRVRHIRRISERIYFVLFTD